MAWTDERVIALEKLVKDGLSASQIAKALGDVTRNAVIGKASRMGFGPIGGGKASKPQVARREARDRAAIARGRAAVSRPPRPIIAMSPGVAPNAPAHRIAQPARVRCIDEGPGLALVLTVEPHMCRWPIGDPQDANFTLCGRRRADVGPYCVGHAARGTVKTPPARELVRSLRRYA